MTCASAIGVGAPDELHAAVETAGAATLCGLSKDAAVGGVTNDPGAATCKSCRLLSVIGGIAGMLMALESQGIPVPRPVAMERARNITAWLDLEYGIGRPR